VSHTTRLQLVPLGGLGEFGLNLMVYRFGGDCLVVDAGMMFPGEEHLGVDVVLPDLSFLDDCGTLRGLVLTHGHEDHIGAVPYLLSRHAIPTFGTPFTLALVRRRLAERHGPSAPDLRPLGDAPLRLGPFVVEALPVAHSIPQSRMLAIRTPVGTVVHTADFKLDPQPLDGIGADRARLRALGQEGVLALLSDSTNADRPGTTPPERSVEAPLDQLVAGARGRVLVTTFASHIHRVQLLGRIAARHGRRLALVGASVRAHADLAEGLGLLPLPNGTRIAPEALADLPVERTLIVASGSQGEPLSAMSRIALGQHRHVRIDDGDLAILSAREIPGSARSIGRLVNHLMRRGAEVVTPVEAPVHVSGHGSRDELREMIDLLQPRFVVPIHGEYRQLVAHARLAADAGLGSRRVQVADSGDVIALDERRIEVVDRVHVGRVYIDGAADEVDLAVLRDRRRIAGDGIVIPVVAVDRDSGTVNGDPEIVVRGVASGGDGAEEELLAEARAVVSGALAAATPEERRDEALLRARLQNELRRFLRRRTQRRPLVIPVILGV
jgi:ribonuclease J